MPRFPMQMPQQSADDQGRSIWQRLSEAYEEAEKKKKYAQLGSIGTFLGATLAGPGVKPAYAPFEMIAGMADDKVGSARQALADYERLAGVQSELEQAQSLEEHRNQQLELERQRMEQDADQFESSQQLQMDQNELRQSELEEQGMAEEEFREHQMEMGRHSMEMDERQLALQRYQAARSGQASGAPASVPGQPSLSRVPGYATSPEAQPSKEDEGAMKKSAEGASKLKSLVDQYKSAHGQYGDARYGEGNRVMSSLRSQMALAAKDTAALGQLSGDDQKLVQDLLGLKRPSLGEAIWPGSKVPGQLESAKQWAETNEQATAGARGFDKIEEERMIGGKKMVKIGGEWFEVTP